jgi:hypothetical protein
MPSKRRTNHNKEEPKVKEAPPRRDEMVKGLFFGMLLGVGLAWFLSTEEGEELKERFRKESGNLVDRAREALDASLKDDFNQDEKS